MKRAIKWVLSALAVLLSPVQCVANEREGEGEKQAVNTVEVPMQGDKFDFQAMVYNLLGIKPDAQNILEEVNCRYRKAMEADADDESKKAANEVSAANEAREAAVKAAGEVTAKLNEQTQLAANEKQRADKANADLQAANAKITKLETEAANERQQHIQTVLDAGVNMNRITKAQVEDWRKQLAADFTAANERLSKLTPPLPRAGIQPGALKTREQAPVNDDMAARRDKVITACNEVMAADKCDWNTAFAKVSTTRKELFAGMKLPETLVEKAD